MVPEELIIVDTPVGEGRLRWRQPSGAPRAVLLLGHGAGGQVDAVDLARLSATLPDHGVAVVRLEQPWKVAGRRIAGPPAQLDLAFGAAIQEVRRRLPGVPLITGGRSQGARIACRTAADRGAEGTEEPVAAVLCLSFPLHPPGRPEKSRLDELLVPDQPVLVCQGTRDTFGTADEVASLAAEAANVTVLEMPGADHSMRRRKSDPLTGTELAERLVDAVLDLVSSSID